LIEQLAVPARAVGGFVEMSIDTFIKIFRRPFQFREFLDQTWMIARVSLVPTLLGFDPLWQAVHEEDARELLLGFLEAPVSGTFNVAAEDVLPLSSLIRLAGTLPLPQIGRAHV